MWKVVISSNLNPPLKLFFYLPILTNNNLLFKIYCENIVIVFFNQDFLFFILFFFLSFHFHPYTCLFFLFLFSFSCFSPPHKYLAPLLLFSFSPQEHSGISHSLHIRERERELVRCPTADGDRGHRKDKTSGDRRSPCSTTTFAAPPPLVLLPTTRLGQIDLFFFYFYFFIFACSVRSNTERERQRERV